MVNSATKARLYNKRLLYDFDDIGLTSTIYLASGNRKLARSILTWSLPAITTCIGRGSCVRYCYGTKHGYKISQVVARHRLNYKLSQDSQFPWLMMHRLSNSSKPVVRIHDIGDFYSQEYLDKWKMIAQMTPNKTFYAYTKSFALDLWNNLPHNFIIIQSYGSKYDNKIDPSRSVCKVIQHHEIQKYRDSGWYVCPFFEDDFGFCGIDCSVCLTHGSAKIAMLMH